MALFDVSYWCARFSLAGIAYCIREYMKEEESFDPNFKLQSLALDRSSQSIDGHLPSSHGLEYYDCG